VAPTAPERFCHPEVRAFCGPKDLCTPGELHRCFASLSMTRLVVATRLSRVYFALIPKGWAL